MTLSPSNNYELHTLIATDVHCATCDSADCLCRDCHVFRFAPIAWRQSLCLAVRAKKLKRQWITSRFAQPSVSLAVEMYLTELFSGSEIEFGENIGCTLFTSNVTSAGHYFQKKKLSIKKMKNVFKLYLWWLSTAK